MGHKREALPLLTAAAVMRSQEKLGFKVFPSLYFQAWALKCECAWVWNCPVGFSSLGKSVEGDV